MDIQKEVEVLILEDDLERKRASFRKIYEEALERKIFLSSIHPLYRARGRGEIKGFTVPAINLRALTYDLASALIRTAIRNEASAFIFEIAKSEIGYTHQRPLEYAGVCLAAAIKEGYKGALFIQGDHFQLNQTKYKKGPYEEINSLKELIREAIGVGFLNIDIDSSTLVDLSKPTIKEQQKENFYVCALLTKFIREIQPQGITISIGGEIGEVGGKNSTPEELEAFMQGYQEELGELEGISKISVQTGTTHGGVVLPNGSIAKVKIDFETLRKLSEISRSRWQLAGCVQHGASTLPEEAFGKFPQTETAEIHLATEFQNIIFESPFFPAKLRERMYDWIKENLRGEWKEDQTEEQFIYKTRKKALGPFKKELMKLPAQIREKIASEVEKKFDFLFKQLNVVGTKKMVEKYIPLKCVSLDLSKVTLVDSQGAD